MRRWTEQEDLLVYELVVQTPENTKTAFKKAAEQLGRTKAAVATRWYSHISKQQGAIAFMLLSEKKSWINRKNPTESTPVTEVKTSLWRRLLRVLGIA